MMGRTQLTCARVELFFLGVYFISGKSRSLTVFWKIDIPWVFNFRVCRGRDYGFWKLIFVAVLLPFTYQPTCNIYIGLYWVFSVNLHHFSLDFEWEFVHISIQVERKICCVPEKKEIPTAASIFANKAKKVKASISLENVKLLPTDVFLQLKQFTKYRYAWYLMFLPFSLCFFLLVSNCLPVYYF